MKNKQTKTITRVFSPLPKTVTETGSLYLLYSKIFPRNADFKEAQRSIVEWRTKQHEFRICYNEAPYD